jgi:uncharacterized membrane protein YoaT (DUF817 family)
LPTNVPETEPLLPLAPRPLGEFARQQALSCLFPMAIFASLALSKAAVFPPWLPRYDLLLALCLGFQWGMYRAGLETRDEIKVVSVFHLLGLGLEVFKTRAGSWSYPEFGYFSVAGVPLYAGFMHASVASYFCQVWRRFDLTLVGMPPARVSAPLAAAIYANFFTHHLPGVPDLRWPLSLLVCAVYRRAWARYRVLGRWYRMPLAAGFALVGLFVYVAENVCTFFDAWRYPNQAHGWQPVHASRISSWALLVVLSFLLVAALKEVKGRRGETRAG